MAASPTLPTPVDSKADPASQTFIREVTDDFERDKLKSLWDRYGRTLIVAISLSLIAFAGYLLWQGSRARQRVVDADTYITGIKDLASGNEAAAVKTFTTLQTSGTQGYKILAAFELAASDLRNKKPADAAKKFDALAVRTDLPKPLQELAALRAIMVRFDDLAPKDAITRLSPFAQPGKPWFATAAELQAIAYLKDGKQQEARKLFDLLAKPVAVFGGAASNAAVDDVPVTVRQRASQMAQMLGSAAAPEPVAGAQTPGTPPATPPAAEPALAK